LRLVALWNAPGAEFESLHATTGPHGPHTWGFFGAARVQNTHPTEVVDALGERRDLRRVRDDDAVGTVRRTRTPAAARPSDNGSLERQLATKGLTN
jgi:hypothetical protein